MLSTDLLAQARLLAQKEPKRPKQASLRRAISDAYYALFHFLVDKSCRFLVSGTSPNRKALRGKLARSFEHGVMKSASAAFARAQSPWIAKGAPCPVELIRVAEAFVVLQQQRHDADYNVERHFSRLEALALIARAQAAMNDWRAAASSAAADAYLLALVVKTRR